MGTTTEFLGQRIVGLAPMAGVTDAPFRAAVRSFGPALVYTEMVASSELLRERRVAVQRLKSEREEGPLAVQIAGRDPSAMAEAARIAEGEGALFIDINMGCPARKVVGGMCGAALMREPALARQLASAVVHAVSLPVTVKMRLGWDDASRNAPELARELCSEGVAAFAVHARTRAQFFEGAADWSYIARVKAAVDVPVLANGDVTSPEDARAVLEVSAADGILIGRAAQGRPWILAAMQAAAAGEPVPEEPAVRVQWGTALTQYRAALSHYGPEVGRRIVRKHLAWYAAAIPGGKDHAKALVRAENPEPLLALLSEGLEAAA